MCDSGACACVTVVVGGEERALVCAKVDVDTLADEPMRLLL